MKAKTSLSPLENRVMRVIWDLGEATAEDVREAFFEDHPMKESTVRTLLRRMEEKGFLAHRVAGRTYIYQAQLAPQKAAVRAVRQIIDRFCGGSVEALLLGMVDDEMIDHEELKRTIDRLSETGGKEP